MEETNHIAILIDAENVLPAHADMIFDYAASLGEIVHKEIYGAAQALTNWVAPVLKYAIHPNLTIRASKGKNSSDIALVIGAMDLLVAGGINTAVIASSDSDFSALSVRLRNAGLEVVGMGMEKANELWRTACSSFVVLQNAKPAPAARQESARREKAESKSAPEKPRAAAEKSKPAPTKSAPKPATATHEERAAVIQQMIAKRLEANGGRLQVSTLFPTLNRMPEYRADRQKIGKKPLNYLTSTFSEVFRFEEAPDGNSWVSLPGAAPLPPAEELAQSADAAESPVEPESAEASPAEAGFIEAEPTASQESAPAEAEMGEPSVAQSIVDRLTADGMEEALARQIAGILEESDGLRNFYNRLRSAFGNTQGREYYQLIKDRYASQEV